ncbi:MAG: hypothetical protein KBD00_02335 [Candidatus Peribacteraceae bacterium]|nr:hypothetical protein [Candidatus Peribacteraceae bacterium]
MSTSRLVPSDHATYDAALINAFHGSASLFRRTKIETPKITTSDLVNDFRERLKNMIIPQSKLTPQSFHENRRIFDHICYRVLSMSAYYHGGKSTQQDMEGKMIDKIQQLASVNKGSHIILEASDPLFKTGVYMQGPEGTQIKAHKRTANERSFAEALSLLPLQEILKKEFPFLFSVEKSNIIDHGYLIRRKILQLLDGKMAVDSDLQQQIFDVMQKNALEIADVQDTNRIQAMAEEFGISDIWNDESNFVFEKLFDGNAKIHERAEKISILSEQKLLVLANQANTEEFNTFTGMVAQYCMVNKITPSKHPLLVLLMLLASLGDDMPVDELRRYLTLES